MAEGKGSCGCSAGARVAAGEAGVLKWLLAINALMFVVELGSGWLAQSTGLIADSLDMSPTPRCTAWRCSRWAAAWRCRSLPRASLGCCS